MATHGVNETFVLLPATLNIAAPAGEINATRKYKGVSYGQVLADVTPRDFINTGIALKPFAPVHLEGGRNGAGDLIASWIRRTRTGGAWLSGADVPLGEASEQYRVNLYSAGFAALVKTYNVSANNAINYNVASQTADFGSPQATIYMGVAQAGSYGFGYETRGIL
jgi:hypothetical protein